MSQLINGPADYVDEMLDGLIATHPSLQRSKANPRVIVRAAGASRRVGIVSGGGSGHLPLFTGYVGEGLLDACAIGNVFEGPNAQSCMDAIRVADRGGGVLCLYGNYGGDRMNFDMACELLHPEIATRTVLATDDVASAAPPVRDTRRGVAGIVYAYKTAGALADRGADLNAVAEIAGRTVSNTRTIGLALSPTRLPGATGTSFELPSGQVEMGMGIHGEPGIWRDRLKPADALADEMLERLLADAPPQGQTVSVLVNSLGATPLEELYIVYRRLAARLAVAGYAVVSPLVGRYTTSMEMAGISISLCFLDAELKQLLHAPASCPFWVVR